MLLRRLILAGLAPLLSLPGLVAAMSTVPVATHEGARAQVHPELFAELWRTVVSLVGHDADPGLATSAAAHAKLRSGKLERPVHWHSTQEILPVRALAHSARGRSLRVPREPVTAPARDLHILFSPLRC